MRTHHILIKLVGLSGEISDVDGKPYTTLSYANGLGYSTAFSADGVRPDLTDVDTSNHNKLSLCS